MYGGSDRILMGIDLSVNVVDIRISGLSTNHNTTSPGSKRLISTFLSFEMFVVTDLRRNVCVYDCSIDLFKIKRTFDLVFREYLLEEDMSFLSFLSCSSF